MDKIGDKNWGIVSGGFLFVVGFNMDEVRGVGVGEVRDEMYKNEIVYINEDVYIWYVKIENILYIGEYSWCVDEARSGSIWVSAAQIVHFTPQITKNKL